MHSDWVLQGKQIQETEADAAMPFVTCFGSRTLGPDSARKHFYDCEPRKVRVSGSHVGISYCIPHNCEGISLFSEQNDIMVGLNASS